MDNETDGTVSIEDAVKVADGPINFGMDLYLITKEKLEEAGYSPGEAHEKAIEMSGMKEYFDNMPGDEMKKGGRVKRAAGGILDLGGREKDYRFNGGFVPIGEYEKKDDVPARLSKNEFVFTADAVRAAGGGSINKGAQKMYNTMKTLEAKPQAKRMTA